MTLAETLYLWLVPSGIVIGHIGIAAKLLPRWPILGGASRFLAWIYAVAVAVVWAMRYREAGHLPLFGTYESALSLALATMLVAVCWEVAIRGRLWITPVAALIAGALLGHGRGYDPTPYALTISERSWVVDIHAWMAWLAFGVLAVNSILALRVLLTRTGSHSLKLPVSVPAAPGLVSVPADIGSDGTDGEQGLKRPASAPAAPDPAPAPTDRGLVFSLQLGFLLHTAMLASGSFYKFLLFGTAWTFDPVETLGFVAWVAYGTLLHMVLFAGWDGRRLAAWCFGLFFILVVSYRGIVYFPAWATYHIFDMDLRIHLTPGEEIPAEETP